MTNLQRRCLREGEGEREIEREGEGERERLNRKLDERGAESAVEQTPRESFE